MKNLVVVVDVVVVVREMEFSFGPFLWKNGTVSHGPEPHRTTKNIHISREGKRSYSTTS